MEQIGTDEPQEHITLSGESTIQEEIGLSEEATIETFEQELLEAELDYSDRVNKKQEGKANQALEKIKLLKRGIELIILTNQRNIKQEDPKIKQLFKEMEEKIQELGFNNYDDIIQEIIDLQEKLQQPIANQVKKKGFEQDLRDCLEVQALHEEIQIIQCKNKQLNLNNEQFEIEFTQLLEELGTKLEDIQQEIQECKIEIQKYIGKNEKKEKQSRENLIKYERLNQLAQILQKQKSDPIPDQKNVQVYDQVDNNQEQEESKSMNEQKEAALKDYMQQKLMEAIVANYDRTKNNVQSFEKSLNECLYHLLNKITPIKNAKEISNEELLRLIEDLQLREQIEELGLNQQLNVAISFIKTTQNYDKVLDDLKVLAFNSSLIAFNFLEFIYLMNLVQHTTNIIQDKDIILFLGVTGSGKSTTIKYLCGSTMRQMKVNGLNHIEAVEVKYSQLKSIKSSPFAKSETKYITPITILDDYNEEVILVDSPGSGDLESVEVDLANSLGIFKSVRQARSVRLVLMFGYQNLGNRFEHLKEQLKLYSSIIKNLQKNCKTITYAFTKIPQDQTDQIEFTLKSIQGKLNKDDMNNNDLKTILQDAINKSKSKQIIFINPLDKEPSKVLQKILSSQKIENPEASFKFTLNSRTESFIKQEFDLYENKIEKSISKNNEYPLAIEKLHILKSVSTILEDNNYTQTLYQNAIKKIKMIFLLYGRKVEKFIKRHQVIENVVSDEEIKEVKDNFQKLNGMKPIKEEFFNDEEIKGTSDYEIELRELVSNHSSNLKIKNIDDRIWDIFQDKIAVFSQEFEKCSEIHSQSFQYYQERMQQHLNQFERLVTDEIERSNIEKLGEENLSQSESTKLFQRLIKARETLKNPTYLKLLDQAQEQQEEKIKLKFETIYNKNIQKYFINEDNNLNFNNDGAQLINNYHLLLESFYFNYNQQSKNLKNFFEEEQASLKKKMLQLFNKCLKDFKDLLQKEEDTKLYYTYETILCFKNIKAINNDIHSQFLDLSLDIEQQMKTNKEKINRILFSQTKLDSTGIESQLSQLKASLKKVKQLSMLMNNQQLLDQFKKDVSQELIDWKDSLMRKTPPKMWGVFQQNKIGEIFQAYKLLSLIENCFSILNIEDCNLSKDLKIQLDEIFNQIQQQITKIDNSYIKTSIKQSDFASLYQHFQTIIIAEQNSFQHFHNKDSNSIIMLSTLEQRIQEILKNQTNLISSELKQYFKELHQIYDDANSKSENEMFEQLKNYDDIIKKIIQKVKLINDAEKEQNKFFLIMKVEIIEIQESWQRKLQVQKKHIKSRLNDLQKTPNQKIQQTYLAFVKSLCKFEKLISGDDKKMKDIYKKYKKIFFKNQSQNEYQDKIKQELKKDPYSCKQINEYIHKLKESEILSDIQTLFYNHVMETRDKLSQNQEGNQLEFGIAVVIEVIKKLLKLQNEIDPTGILDNNFKVLIQETLEELDSKQEQLLLQNMDSMKYNIDQEDYMQIDTLLENIQIQLQALDMLNKDKIKEPQQKFSTFKNQVCEQINVILNKIDEEGLIYIQNNPFIFVNEELKNNELSSHFTKIKTKVQTKIKEQIYIYGKLDNFDDQIENLKILDSIFTQLPIKYTTELIQIKKTLDEKVENIKLEEYKQIEQLQISQNFQELHQIYLSTHQNLKKREKIEESFEKMATEQIEIALNFFKELNIADTLKFLAHAYEPLNILQKHHHSHIQSKYDFAIQGLTDQIEECVKSIQFYSTMPLQEEQLKQNIMQIQNYYRELKKTQILHKNQVLMNTMANIDKLFQDLSKNIFDLQDSVIQNDATQQNFQIHQLIQDYQKFQQSFQILKLFSEKNFIKLIGNEQQINLEEDNFGYSKVEQKVNQNFQEFFNQIRSLELMQDGIESEKARKHQPIDKINNNLDYLCSLKNFSIQNITQETIINQKQQFDKAIEDQFREIYQKINELLPNIFESDKQTQKEFNNYYLNLVSMAHNIKSIHSISLQIKNFLKEIEQRIKQQIKIQQKQIVQVAEQDHEKASQILIILQQFSQNIMLFQAHVSKAFEQIFDELKQVFAKEKFVQVVMGMYLYLSNSPIGLSIIDENPIFENQQRAIFNKKIQAFGIDYVLEHLSDNNNNEIDIAKLKKRYGQFEETYKNNLQKYLGQNISLKNLVKQIKDKSMINVKNGKDITDSVPELVALIFVLWSLINATTFFNPDPTSKSNDYLLQPHPAQVISIFRILGIGYKVEYSLVGFTLWTKTSNSLINNLVEIRTGEGKSITLGVVSIIFALLGYKVNCVCYSKYLSERDFSSFSSLFEELEVDDKIFYGTFNEICEKMINKKGDIREMIMKEVLKDYKPQNVQLSIQNQNEKEVLLIDEVDVFFSKSFYGALYQPKVSIQHQKIKDLILYIWENQAKQLKLKDIEHQSVYRECQSIFNPDYVFLLDEALKNMLFDLGELKNHKEYECIGGKLGYKEQDQINFKISIRYLTMWANCKEYDAKQITEENRDKQLCIGLKCGAFSYAEIARKYFPITLGVSGTLNTLTDTEKNILKKYNITSLTFIPSVYGDNNLSFRQRGDILITDKDQQYLDFIRNIQSNISRNGYERSVIVIFEDEKKLQDFFKCEQFAQIRSQRTVIRLTEKCNDLEKKNFRY